MPIIDHMNNLYKIGFQLEGFGFFALISNNLHSVVKALVKKGLTK